MSGPCSICRRRGPSSSITAIISGPRPIKAGVKDAFNYPGFVPAYIRPLFCEGKGPFRWAALSGDPDDIYKTDEAILKEFPDDESSGAVDPAGQGEGQIPGASGKDLLAGIRSEGQGGKALQRSWWPGRN